ncbi:hypothetical protein [Nocardia cyriacigeorgica]|uniref:hypothetical protein n=1 Tax=Nocardia cyriacigeorgica TaxID=135487 RepID=UPI00245479A2|nr:hypothetical protein [Nocardia cyriacigeorgica]
MSTIPDPATRFPLPHTDRTVFLAPHITSDSIEVGDYTYFDDPHAATEFETNNVLYPFGPEKLIIGRYCAIATGTRFIMAGANHPTHGVSTFPFTIFGGNPARTVKQRFDDDDVDRLLRAAWWNWPVELVTEHVRTIMSGTPAQIEKIARDNGLLAESPN